MADIKKFPDSAEARERRRQKAALQASQREANSADDGKKAWVKVTQWREEKKEKLKEYERVAIAQNLWEELDGYQGKYQGKLADLYIDAGLPSNIKDKLTLQSGKVSNSKLKAEVFPYLKLIEALARKAAKQKNSSEDLERYLLADRVLMGTQFHPVSHVKLQEAQLILDALQVAVDRIDREFKLWEQCEAVAVIRKPREERYVDAVRKDDEETAWAELQLNEDNIPHRVGAPVYKWWPLEEWLLMSLTIDQADSEKRLVSTPIEPANAFWATNEDALVSSGESIFFFPHSYLGPTIEWRDGKPEAYEEDDSWVDINTDPEPQVRFDDESQQYRVYLRDPKTGEEHHGGAEDDWGMSWSMSHAARWLVIYPDRDAKRLIPAIFSRGEWLSTELLPLTARLIAEFGETNHWQYVGRDAPSLLQRLKNLTGFVTGNFEVYAAWYKTAERFHWNPIFRSTDPSETKNIIYRRHLERWIAENQSPTDSHDDE